MKIKSRLFQKVHYGQKYHKEHARKKETRMRIPTQEQGSTKKD